MNVLFFYLDDDNLSIIFVMKSLNHICVDFLICPLYFKIKIQKINFNENFNIFFSHSRGSSCVLPEL